MRVLLVNPPLSDPAGPYPSICYLAGFLDTIGIHADLADASLALMRRLFTPDGLEAVRQEILSRDGTNERVLESHVSAFLGRFQWYADTVEVAIACLRHTGSTEAWPARGSDYFPPPVASDEALRPEAGPTVPGVDVRLGQDEQARRDVLADAGARLRSTFASPGDLARLRASVVLRDLVGVIRAGCDPDFGLLSYAERLQDDIATFEPVRNRLERRPGVIDRFIDEVATELSDVHRPDVVGLTVPFPGTLHGALRIARRLKAVNPDVQTILGGGWVNTTLRHLRDPGIFDYIDFITLDDGRAPTAMLARAASGTAGGAPAAPDVCAAGWRRGLCQ